MANKNPPAAQRPAEFRKLLERRQAEGRGLADDATARRQLAAMLPHLYALPEGGWRCDQFLRRFAPWLPEDEAEAMIQEAASARPIFDPETLGEVLQVTYEERKDCGIRLVQQVDVPLDEVRRRQLEAKRLGAREYRRQKRERRGEQRPRGRPPGAGISHRASALITVLKQAGRPMTIEELGAAVFWMPPFKDGRNRPLGKGSLHRVVSRAADELCAPGLQLAISAYEPTKFKSKRRLIWAASDGAGGQNRQFPRPSEVRR